MEAVAVRKRVSQLDMLTLIAGSKNPNTTRLMPKIRHRTARLSECLQPKSWEDKFDGLWCNETEY